jgi:hypothetical protein
MIERMLGLYRGIDRGFTVKQCHEHRRERHDHGLG